MQVLCSSNHTQLFKLAAGAVGAAASNATSRMATASVPSSTVVPRVAMVEKVAGSASWYDARLDAIADLKADWDGYGAPPIPLCVISQMRSLLGRFLPKGSARGFIVPGADGSLQAEWHMREGSLGLIVEEDELATVWLRVGSKERERRGIQALDMFETVARSLLHV